MVALKWPKPPPAWAGQRLRNSDLAGELIGLTISLDGIGGQPRRDGRTVEPIRRDLYDGRVRLGDVTEHHSGQWEAAIAGGELLGLFTSETAAVLAVLTAERDGGAR